MSRVVSSTNPAAVQGSGVFCEGLCLLEFESSQKTMLNAYSEWMAPMDVILSAQALQPPVPGEFMSQLHTLPMKGASAGGCTYRLADGEYLVTRSVSSFEGDEVVIQIVGATSLPETGANFLVLR